MKKMNFHFNFTDDDYALIKSEYTTSCGYIHGSIILDENLSLVFNDCLKKDSPIKNINSYFDRIKKIFKLYDQMLISEYADFIDYCFHREKSILQYLLGKECINLLFDII